MSLLLKPVPTLHKKLVFDKSLSRVSKSCFASQAKLPAFPVNVVREAAALVVVEAHEAVPFVVSEVPPSRHNVPPTVEPLNDSTILLFEGVEQSIIEWALDYGITPAIIIGRLERGMTSADAITAPMKVGHRGQHLPIYSRKQLVVSCRRVRKPVLRKLPTRHAVGNMSLSLKEWADHLGITYNALCQRMHKVGSLEAAVLNVSHPTVPGVVSNLPASKGTGGGEDRTRESRNNFF